MLKPTQSQIPAGELFENIRQFLHEGYDASFTVTGSSMLPFLAHKRDQVVLENCEGKKLKKGDIVLFMPEPERYLLHRIDRVWEGKFRTVGDANCFRDGIFDRSCVVGRVVYLIRKGKKISCTNWFYRLISYVWIELFWMRSLLLKIMRKLARQKKLNTRK